MLPPPPTPPGTCTDAEYDHDAGLEHLERRGVVGRKGGREKEAAREKQRQVREYQKHTSALVSLVGRAVSLVFRDVSLVFIVGSEFGVQGRAGQGRAW